jgi:putative ABC transport system permease protein
MRDVLYLAWRYLAYNKVKTAVLVAAVTVTVYLPAGLQILVSQSAAELTARAQATPLLVGAKGSPLELVLNSLYFASDTPSTLPYAQVSRVEESGLARAIPLYTRYRAHEGRIVGTTLEYFEFRGLEIARGRTLEMLGECVLGARVARQANLEPGDYVLSAKESVFDITDYPLKMKVVGVLKPVGTADDEVVFVDVKTAWVIEGLGHGHQDLRQPGASSGVLRTEGKKIIANASVVVYNEITPENLSSFHFHGDPETFPLTSVIVLPPDEKSSTLLQGRYLGDKEVVQIVKPTTVMNELLDTILTVRNYVLVAVVLVGVATLATMILVFTLSLQLRKREIETMRKIGGSRLRMGSIVIMEIAGVLLAGLLLAGLLSLLTAAVAPVATRALILLS